MRNCNFSCVLCSCSLSTVKCLTILSFSCIAILYWSTSLWRVVVVARSWVRTPLRSCSSACSLFISPCCCVLALLTSSLSLCACSSSFTIRSFSWITRCKSWCDERSFSLTARLRLTIWSCNSATVDSFSRNKSSFSLRDCNNILCNSSLSRNTCSNSDPWVSVVLFSNVTFESCSRKDWISLSRSLRALFRWFFTVWSNDWKLMSMLSTFSSSLLSESVTERTSCKILFFNSRVSRYFCSRISSLSLLTFSRSTKMELFSFRLLSRTCFSSLSLDSTTFLNEFICSSNSFNLLSLLAKFDFSRESSLSSDRRLTNCLERSSLSASNLSAKWHFSSNVWLADSWSSCSFDISKSFSSFSLNAESLSRNNTSLSSRSLLNCGSIPCGDGSEESVLPNSARVEICLSFSWTRVVKVSCSTCSPCIWRLSWSLSSSNRCDSLLLLLLYSSTSFCSAEFLSLSFPISFAWDSFKASSRACSLCSKCEAWSLLFIFSLMASSLSSKVNSSSLRRFKSSNNLSLSSLSCCSLPSYASRTWWLFWSVWFTSSIKEASFCFRAVISWSFSSSSLKSCACRYIASSTPCAPAFEAFTTWVWMTCSFSFSALDNFAKSNLSRSMSAPFSLRSSSSLSTCKSLNPSCLDISSFSAMLTNNFSSNSLQLLKWLSAATTSLLFSSFNTSISADVSLSSELSLSTFAPLCWSSSSRFSFSRKRTICFPSRSLHLASVIWILWFSCSISFTRLDLSVVCFSWTFAFSLYSSIKLCRTSFSINILLFSATSDSIRFSFSWTILSKFSLSSSTFSSCLPFSVNNNSKPFFSSVDSSWLCWFCPMISSNSLFLPRSKEHSCRVSSKSLTKSSCSVWRRLISLSFELVKSNKWLLKLSSISQILSSRSLIIIIKSLFSSEMLLTSSFFASSLLCKSFSIDVFSSICWISCSVCSRTRELSSLNFSTHLFRSSRSNCIRSSSSSESFPADELLMSRVTNSFSNICHASTRCLFFDEMWSFSCRSREISSSSWLLPKNTCNSFTWRLRLNTRPSRASFSPSQSFWANSNSSNCCR